MAVADFLDGAVRPHSIYSPAIRREGDTCVAARLEDTLSISFEVGGVPFINSTIHTTRYQLGIVPTPTNTTDLTDEETKKSKRMMQLVTIFSVTFYLETYSKY